MPASDSPALPSRSRAPHAASPRTPEPADAPVRRTVRPAGLERLNAVPAEEAVSALLRCCGSRRWAGLLAGHRPYPDLAALLAASDEASYDLTPEDLTEALAREGTLQAPPAGARGPGTLAAHTALRAAHAAYESRFGHAFVVCTADCPPDEVLDRVLVSLHARLGNPPEEERAVTAEELRRSARARLEELVTRP
ncbi:2-oxo-4-hydroxy-4-carboxy-5-ureidoimidazoline decarboxylase [Streptomyces sp. HB2AG]|uniref:2-oxo-4-hydroxy-4-carboxy-5-ureidoimidazoline decarboxylase n=1 Tax=Streptomyces sp. HB2AG TaxID=2983400 RepID=UPI0022AA9D37|nr:2-oxo-4-hydroxy-4-carboxy-5-ureidoimidazoline decarboxylase [Streptomyces sp. HB2AG]MCZ2527414.1 2-oxo-4-hydroxy-4-carboxy-5-ureidoimidazoline decarboxylase [Streptomyces sp. HB2AG]